MNAKTESPAHDAPDENRTPESAQEHALGTDPETLGGLDVDELRAMPRALVWILSAMGC